MNNTLKQAWNWLQSGWSGRRNEKRLVLERQGADRPGKENASRSEPEGWLQQIALDTITTRFFMVFICLLAIPLASVILFTLSLLNTEASNHAEHQTQLLFESFNTALKREERLLESRSFLDSPTHDQTLAQTRSTPLLSSPTTSDTTDQVIHQGGYVFDQDKLFYATKSSDTFQINEAFISGFFKQLPSANAQLVLANESNIHQQDENYSLITGGNPILGPSQQQLLLAQLKTLPTNRPVNIKLGKSQTFGQNSYWILQSFLFGSENQRVARAVMILPAQNAILFKTYYWAIYLVAGISLILSVVLAMVAGRPITQPLIQLIKQVEAISHNNLQQGRISVYGVYETKRLGLAFNRMLDRLQQEHRLRDEFVATLTHDLKVPMLAEKQALSYLTRGTYGELTQTQLEIIDAIQSTNSSSLALVNGLLEVYRYEAGTVSLKMSQWDILALLQETLQELSSLAAEKQINLSLNSRLAKNEPAIVFGDAMEIKRTLQNLISNAIINTPRHGSIQCRVETSESLKRERISMISPFKRSTLQHPLYFKGRVLVSVQDSGIGFTSEDLPNVFRQFSGSRGRNPMSIGLGLYNCYQVIQAHHGNLWIETTEGEGSAVSFLLPQSDQVYADRRREDRRRFNAGPPEVRTKGQPLT